ncbi:hypothetical protein [Massilia horti]|uniref:Uncharacterized protein n=1 Tax=Massilia horti TaxID=2562153 RepID=A0A4Y9SZH7_9BURK|nr:hypothetical protein [Massilia horti]TFW31870.1 hypothetical protein E4O92_12145 [Massilia horti]
MNALPASVECRSILADGSPLLVTATRRPRAGRADVKCSAPGDAALAQRMQQVVRLARLTEPCLDSRDQVVISLDRAPAGTQRGWELAVVLADRMVRGLFHPSRPICANGWSDEWHLGRVTGHDLRNAPANVLLGGPDGLAHLGALTGQPDQSAAVATGSCWFPLHSGGINDSLCRIDVSVYPFPHDGAEEEGAIAVPGVDAARQLAVRHALAQARHFDGRGVGRWRTVVRFDQAGFSGESYELALVLADRIARGREFLARGRLIASGCSSAWHAGRVDTVEGLAPKCALIVREAAPGDRVLLPKAWQPMLPDGFADELRSRGASVACIERIGII